VTTVTEPRQLYSVAELQQALAIARSRAGQRHAGPADTAVTGRTAGQPTASEETAAAVPKAVLAGSVVVVSAHAGGGASTVALALADAAAAEGSRVRLVDCAPAGESGLAEAATEVLGVDAVGGGYRGRRGLVMIDHPLGADAGQASDGPDPRLTVIDAGPAGRTPRPVVIAAAGVVVACQATAPGLRRAETLVAELGVPVVLAVIGPRKWPAVVRASLGPALTGLRRGRRLVPVPLHPQLVAAGLTGEPLPRRVLAAARQVLAAMSLTDPPAGPAQASAAVVKELGRWRLS
jgi:hypothetical protein